MRLHLLITLVLAWHAHCLTIPVESDPDVLVDQPMNMDSSSSAIAEMNGNVPSSTADVMPSTSKAAEMETDPVEQSVPFDNMEGEHEAVNVPKPKAAPQKIPKSKTSKGMLANMANSDNRQVKPVPKVGAEIDLASMPGSTPQSTDSTPVSNMQTISSSPMSLEDEDADPPAELDSKMKKNNYASENLASEEAKMNEGQDSPSTEEDASTTMNTMSESNDRMNTENTKTNGNEAYDTGMDVVNVQASQASPVTSETADDEPDSDNTMNASEMNSATGHSVDKMNANVMTKTTNNPNVFAMMNTGKPNTVQQQQLMVSVETKTDTAEVVESSAVDTSTMESTSSEGMAQVPEVAAEMPSTSTGLMPESVQPHSDGIVSEDHEATMTNDPALEKAFTQKEPAVASAPIVKPERNMEMTMNDGDAMGDMSKLHHPVIPANTNAPAGYMDEGEASQGDISSEMNTVKQGLNMMATVASFLAEDEHVQQLVQTQSQSKPFYNQYSPQTSQPQPLPGLTAPPAVHPYGLPYFHRDPFMPLQTPYYHIPSFDNPQRNPALTPYYNPFVNPPPPLPPSVPAAPSFFPFHHPQHMIPPYFPYPPAPVLQPGPFPPYALPSHLKPGEREPSARFSHLPEKRGDDPF